MFRRSLGLLLLGVVVLYADPLAGKSDLGKQLKRVERSIDGRFERFIDPSPMVLVGVTRGFHLERFGVVFSLEVNVFPTPNLSPFFKGYDEEQKRNLNRRKKERLKSLESLARKILTEEAAKIEALPTDETVALAISMFYYNWEHIAGLPLHVVVQAPKSALLDYENGRLTDSEFNRQVEVTSLF